METTPPPATATAAAFPPAVAAKACMGQSGGHDAVKNHQAHSMELQAASVEQCQAVPYPGNSTRRDQIWKWGFDGVLIRVEHCTFAVEQAYAFLCVYSAPYLNAIICFWVLRFVDAVLGFAVMHAANANLPIRSKC